MFHGVSLELLFVKDVHNHASVKAQPRDLSKYRPLVNRTNEVPASNQVTTEISWTNMTNNFFADFCDWLSPFFPSYAHLHLFKKDLYVCVCMYAHAYHTFICISVYVFNEYALYLVLTY